MSLAVIVGGVLVVYVMARRRLPLEEAVDGIPATGQRARRLDACLEIRALVAAERFSTAREFVEERIEREGVVPYLDDGSQFLLRRLSCPLQRFRALARLTTASRASLGCGVRDSAA